jgi:hypothetical protein
MANEEKSRSRTRNPVIRIRIHIRSYGSEILVKIGRIYKEKSLAYSGNFLALRYRQAGARIGAHALGTGAREYFLPPVASWG